MTHSSPTRRSSELHRSNWNSANIVPKDPVTLGLCSQRELDALVAKAAKKAGIKAPEDSRFEGDREALLEELRAERTAANEELGRASVRESRGQYGELSVVAVALNKKI